MAFSTAPATNDLAAAPSPAVSVSAARQARAGALVDAARDLATRTGSAAFTVGQVAAAARCSLKGFYSCFAGKDELLLALLATDSATGAELLRREVCALAPGDRFDAFVHALFDLCVRPEAEGYAGVLVREHRRLDDHDPDALRAAMAPLVSVLEADCGVRDSDIVFDVLIGGISEVVLHGADARLTAARLARFCRYGIDGGIAHGRH